MAEGSIQRGVSQDFEAQLTSGILNRPGFSGDSFV
jgi:hypothetical protein